MTKFELATPCSRSRSVRCTHCAPTYKENVFSRRPWWACIGYPNQAISRKRSLLTLESFCQFFFLSTSFRYCFLRRSSSRCNWISRLWFLNSLVSLYISSWVALAFLFFSFMSDEIAVPWVRMIAVNITRKILICFMVLILKRMDCGTKGSMGFA